MCQGLSYEWGGHCDTIMFKMPTFEMGGGGNVRREESISVLGLSYGMGINF